MTMPPDELSTEELYKEAKKMRRELLAAVDELNGFAAALAELAVKQEHEQLGEDSE
ncbi:MAG: hypothetical protein JWO11_3509 [Nocardioides sp.]|jgi:hypothetical protein|nr:hypothetical protein [Nocardioides sp.]